LLPQTVMRMLEARFHPRRKAVGEFIVVGHVVWGGESTRPVVQAAAGLPRGKGATLLSKVQYLVSISACESFERLRALRSQFWSFVEV